MSLRLRLTLLYGVLLAAVLAAFSASAYFIASQRIYGGVDDGLRIQAESIIGALGPAKNPLSRDQIADIRTRLEAEAAAGAVFQILDASGDVLYASPEPVARRLPPEGATGTGGFLVTKQVEGRRLRILTEPVVGDGQVLGTVEVAQSLKQTDEALAEIRTVFIFGGLGALLLTSVAAYLLAGRALDPVRRLARLAHHIERTADFSRRLEPRAGGDMRELVSTFNAMIKRVEKTLASQREFLADSSHELRRPLAVLRTNIDVLNDHGLPPGEREACLSEMRAEAETMGRLLSDLLLLSRDEAQAIERAPVDFSSVCNEAMARLRTRDDSHELIADVTDRIRLIGDKDPSRD